MSNSRSWNHQNKNPIAFVPVSFICFHQYFLWQRNDVLMERPISILSQTKKRSCNSWYLAGRGTGEHGPIPDAQVTAERTCERSACNCLRPWMDKMWLTQVKWRLWVIFYCCRFQWISGNTLRNQRRPVGVTQSVNRGKVNWTTQMVRKWSAFSQGQPWEILSADRDWRLSTI